VARNEQRDKDRFIAVQIAEGAADKHMSSLPERARSRASGGGLSPCNPDDPHGSAGADRGILEEGGKDVQQRVAGANLTG
jgi:hypothetical protein